MERAGTDDRLCELRDVARTFELHGQPIEVLRGIDLTVDAGDAVSIEGPSGAGKSTLLSILGLIDLAFSGTYRFRGVEVSKASDATRADWRLRQLGIAFQDLWLVESLTALENLLVPLFATRTPVGQARQRAADLLAAAGLDHALHHRPSELSGGERRRVAVARSLVNRPRLLIVDEPTAELDATSADRVVELLRRAQTEGAALVAASHDPHVLSLCRRNLRLHAGRLAETATP